MSDNKHLVGLKIKEIRKKNHLTQDIFSERIGIETPSLSNIENGKCFPSMQTVLKIIEEFEIAPSDFFDFEYHKNEFDLETEIIDIIKKQPYDRKQIIFKIVKQFAI